MKKLRRLVLLSTILAALCLALSGCKPLVDDSDIEENFTLYASFYPIYALSDMIVRDVPGMTLRLLVQPQDGCLRLYALSDWDAYLLAQSDAVIIGGQGLELFGDSLTALGEDGPAVVTAMSALTLLRNGDDSESHFDGVNPWLFLSVDGAMDITRAICSNMLALDEPYAQKYTDNLDKALVELSDLRQSMSAALVGCDTDVPIALAHEGLIYLANDMDLNVAAQIERESGVMPDDAEFADMLDALNSGGVRAVLIEKQAPDALIAALARNGYEVIRIDTLSTGVESMGADGYVNAMRNNAEAIATGLKDIQNEGSAR